MIYRIILHNNSLWLLIRIIGRSLQRHEMEILDIILLHQANNNRAIKLFLDFRIRKLHKCEIFI